MTTKTKSPDAILATRCFNDLVRVDQIVHLATMAADSIDGDLYDELIDSAARHIGDQLGISTDEVEEMDREELQEALAWNDVLGWLVHVSTPVQEWHADGKTARFSWGHTYGNWFYADTYEAALEAGFTWAAGMANRGKPEPAKASDA